MGTDPQTHDPQHLHFLGSFRSQKFNLLKPLYIQHKYGKNQLYAHFGQRYFSTPDENFHLSLVKRQFQISLSPSGWRLASAGYQCLASDGALFSVIGVLFIRSGIVMEMCDSDGCEAVRGSRPWCQGQARCQCFASLVTELSSH